MYTSILPAGKELIQMRQSVLVWTRSFPKVIASYFSNNVWDFS